ncbi:NAD binding oxidoreductase [Sphaerosporella brunnea]|uniref:D-xylose 1-dehydrogenase (NADP(+), D-xylono-1,5-lactone-forming) n=1 Tax=Sphaerosporella brunnea TaxID=1250544 RepID=A0A5J5EN83_9PEZI|nr:NAD binding oxidoreductase [Sphaerosporella brunnea]
MAMVLQLSTFVTQYLTASAHEIKDKSPTALRFGVLSTAMINPAAIIHPSETHGDVLLYGVASREYNKARSYAKKYGFSKAYGSYEELLNDADVDAVYIPLPNGMHAEWAIKSLEKGKHVLLEKPLTANADEAKHVFKAAKKAGKVCLEAFHWRFHPAAHVVDALLSSGRYGPVLSTHSRMTTPKGSVPKNNIRWKYELAGGSLMDMSYTISSTRYFLHMPRLEAVNSAAAVPAPHDSRVDAAMNAELTFKSELAPNPVKASIYTDMDRANSYVLIPRVWELPSIQIECENATIYFYNFMMPHLYHYIAITDKKTGHTSYQKHYSFGPKWGTRGESWWSTYRYQLEAFVDKVRGREPVCWIEPEDSVMQMECIDSVYEKSGLGKRKGTSELLREKEKK